MKRTLTIGLLMGLVSASPAYAQDLLKDALASFPKDTIRVEYSSPARLRALPNYSSLRRRYVGPNLVNLESSLEKLGIRENDVDELVMGWRIAGQAAEFFGLASGRFDPKSISKAAAEQGVGTVSVGDRQAYCLGTGKAETCVAVLAASRGVFGPLALLQALEGARASEAASLGSNERFMKYLNGARTDAPIWGVAVGPAIADWFKGWMPGQENLQMDWSSTFGNVEALSYSAQVGENAQLSVNLDCSTPDAAANLRQLLDGVKILQQIAWQNRKPNQPNPFQGLQVAVQGNRVNLNLSSSFAELEGAGAIGAP